MLLKREGFTTGLMDSDHKYQIYHNTTLKTNNQEVKHADTSFDIQDAIQTAKNKESEAFTRKNQDGSTTYYEVKNNPNDIDESYKYTPEELESIPRRKPITQTARPNRHEAPFKNKFTSKPIIGTKEPFMDNVTKKDFNGLFLLVIFLVLITFAIFMVNKTRPPKSICMYTVGQDRQRLELQQSLYKC